MTIYAIGDIQGCFNELKQLLAKIKYRSDKDQLWFTGDLVNRGPDSLETLRFIKSLGDNAISVLGNHDLHMLAVLQGFEQPRRSDTFDEILSAPDKESLTHWVAHLPLMHVENNHVLVHAGIYPDWTIDQARELAKEVESVLQSERFPSFLQHMYGNQPSKWCNTLKGWDRLRFITNTFTRMRYCLEDLSLDLKYNGAPGTQPQHLTPWLDLLDPTQKQYRILFGHWSTLGPSNVDNVYALDGGCLWGGTLIALALEATPRYIHLACSGELQPPSITNLSDNESQALTKQ